MRSAASFLVIVLQIVSCSTSDTSTMPTADSTALDPCSEATEIPSVDRKVSGSSVPGDRCDHDLSTGWYRFTISGVPTTIPTSCIKPQACGSAVSLRIDLGGADLPGAGEEIDAWSCGSYDVLGKYDCCVLRRPALIRNCTTFLAYHLHQPDRCSVSYCVQDINIPVPPHVRVKTGEDVNAVVTTMSATTVTMETSTVSSTPGCTRCTEGGGVCCHRLPVPRCVPEHKCREIPYTTDNVTQEVTTPKDTEAENTTASYDETTPASTVNDTDTTTNGPSSTASAVELGTASSTTSTTVTRSLFPLSTAETADDNTTSLPVAEVTSGHNDSAVDPLPEVSMIPDNDTTDMNTTSQSTAVEETSSFAGNTTSAADMGFGVNTTTSSPEELDTSAFPNLTINDTVSDDSHETTGVSVVTTVGQLHTSHPGSTVSDAASTSSSTVAATAPSSTTELVPQDTSTESPPSGTNTTPSTEVKTSTEVTSFGTATPSSTWISSTITTVTTELPSHTTTAERMSSVASGIDGRIVIEFRNTKSDIDYNSNVRSSLVYLLNTFFRQDSHHHHKFTTNDINILSTNTSSAAIAVVIKVTYEEPGHTVTVDADELIQMLRILQNDNKLNSKEFLEGMGTRIEDFYKYGDHPRSTLAPQADNSFSLFYDKLPLFIAIIVMATICLLICLFGVVYLRCFRHQRSWDREKDAERAKLKDNRFHEGLDNPVSDSEMMKDEQTVTETALTVNGSHPPPIITPDDHKGWVIPIDQAPESLLQVALRTEDTKL